MFFDNNWYGNRYILSTYCNLKDRPALASIQHGLLPSNWYTNNTLETKRRYGQRTFNQIPWLVWNDQIYDTSKKFNATNVYVIGSPIIYLDKIMQKKKIFKTCRNSNISHQVSLWN